MKLWYWESRDIRGVVYAAIAETVEDARAVLFERYSNPDAQTQELLNSRPTGCRGCPLAFTVHNRNETSGLF